MSRTTDTGTADQAHFVCRRTGQTYRVGQQLARTQRSRVYAVESDPVPLAFKLVLKRYESGVLQEEPQLTSRIRAMIAHPPAYRAADTGHVLCAWPEDLAFVDEGFVGYVMPRVDTADAVTLHDLVHGDDTTRPTEPSWSAQLTWADRVLIAANLAGVVALLHDADVVTGDLQSRDILISRDRQVTLLGCDAMQVTDRASGRTYLCRTERQLLAPPELMISSGWATLRPRSGDLFSLAVELHQLLLDGDRPFDGEWRGPGATPSASLLAQNGLWCHGGDERLHPRQDATPLAVLPEALQRSFHAAFVDGARHPYDRPPAREWQAELQRLHESLTGCARSPRHLYGDHLTSCPWCTPPDHPCAPRHRPGRAVSGPPDPPPRSRPRPPARAAASPPQTESALRGSPELGSTLVDGRADGPEQAPAARISATRSSPSSPKANRTDAARPRGRSGALRLAAWLAVAAVGIAGVVTASTFRDSPPEPSTPSITAATRTAPAPTSPSVRPGSPAQVLEQIHTDDAHAAEALADSWVPQLATQPVAPSADDAALSAVLAGHRAVQRLYPNALLLWSADWNYTGSAWITVLNQRFATAEEANGWCDEQHLQPRQCFAKRLSHTHVVDGTVRYRG